MLRIIRQQLPLAPAFATTSHAAQGQTFRHGAIVDLSTSGSTSPLSSYVALTRVRSRKDLLIYRPFDREPFTKGERPGPALLLRHLRGTEPLDWEQIEKDFMPVGTCSHCGHKKQKTMFSQPQFKRPHTERVCKACVNLNREKGTPFQCTRCRVWKSEEDFEDKERVPGRLQNRRCKGCPETRPCRNCEKQKSEPCFNSKEWEKAGREPTSKGYCTECENKQMRGKCSKGREYQPQHHFSKVEWSNWESRQPARCTPCARTEANEVREAKAQKLQDNRKCSECSESAREMFSKCMWLSLDASKRQCKKCVKKNRDYVPCIHWSCKKKTI